MKTKYVIDGSNLMRYLGYVRNQNPQSIIAARERLNRELSKLCERIKNIEVVIVYDVHSFAPFEKIRVGKVEVVYAEGPKESQPADEEIIRIATKKHPYDTEIMVITDDKGLRERLLFLGVRSNSCNDFITKINFRTI